MQMRIPATAAAMAALALVASTVTGTAAFAKGRPCGTGASTQGVGTNGTPWTLKSMYDDDGPMPGHLVVGEEFEINTEAAGQHWTVTFTDNGTQFFSNNDDVSTATGIREVHANPAVHNTVEIMAARAVRKDTGEVITGSVKLDPAPAKCGPLSP